MARRKKAPAPIVSAGASLHRNHLWRQFCDHPNQFGATELTDRDWLKRPGSSTVLTYASAENTPTPGTLMSSRQAEFDLTNTRIALSKTAICWRSCRQATSLGRTIRATSERSSKSFNLSVKWQSPNRAGQKT